MISMRSRRAQVSVEFLVLFIFVVVVFTVFLITAQWTGTMLQQNLARQKSEEIAFQIADLVNDVAAGKNGTAVTLTIPENHTVNFSARSIMVTDIVGNSGSIAVLTDNVTAAVANVQVLTISNIDGGVLVNG